VVEGGPCGAVAVVQGVRVDPVSPGGLRGERDVELLVPGVEESETRDAPASPLAAITPEAIQEAGGLTEIRRQIETRCVEVCLDRTGGNVSQAARWLGVERTNLHKKMQALGLEARPPRSGMDDREQGEEP